MASNCSVGRVNRTKIEHIEGCGPLVVCSGKASRPSKGRAFDREFKLRVVKDYYQQGKNIASTAGKFDIDCKTSAFVGSEGGTNNNAEM